MCQGDLLLCFITQYISYTVLRCHYLANHRKRFREHTAHGAGEVGAETDGSGLRGNADRGLGRPLCPALWPQASELGAARASAQSEGQWEAGGEEQPGWMQDAQVTQGPHTWVFVQPTQGLWAYGCCWTCTRMFTVALFLIVKKQKPPKCRHQRGKTFPPPPYVL